MKESDDFEDNAAPPTFTSSAMQEEEKKADDADNIPDVEKAVVTPYDAIRASNNNNNNIHKKSCWTDERGNLKVVNMVVRHPCKIFWIIIILVLVLTFILNAAVFRTAENGNPFTLPGNEFDLMDVRSLQFDSLRLASDQVKGARAAFATKGKPTLKQSQTEAIQYWYDRDSHLLLHVDFQIAFIECAHSVIILLFIKLFTGCSKQQLLVACSEMNRAFKE